MQTFPRIDRTEAALAAAFLVGLALASVLGMPWAVFAAALGLAALFAAVMHWLTRADRQRRHLADQAAGLHRPPSPDPRARQRKRRH